LFSFRRLVLVFATVALLETAMLLLSLLSKRLLLVFLATLVVLLLILFAELLVMVFFLLLLLLFLKLSSLFSAALLHGQVGQPGLLQPHTFSDRVAGRLITLQFWLLFCKKTTAN